eukprot:8270712-Alexandrium_andersonii.AAC.1
MVEVFPRSRVGWRGCCWRCASSSGTKGAIAEMVCPDGPLTGGQATPGADTAAEGKPDGSCCCCCEAAAAAAAAADAAAVAEGAPKPEGASVSYTHLTLPTICSV